MNEEEVKAQQEAIAPRQRERKKNLFDTNIEEHSLRMIHKASRALIVKTLYYNTVQFFAFYLDCKI